MTISVRRFSSSRASRNLLRLGMLLAILMIVACGKKGPLYIPDDTGPGQTGVPTGNPVVMAIKD